MTQLYLNGTEIAELRLNGVEIDTAYLNGTEVFSAAPQAIGEFWKGGYYFGTLGGYYLMCAATSYHGVNLKWKLTGTDTPNTNSNTNGYSNTSAMITAGASDHPAGALCWNLTAIGFTDWCLPAKDELNLIYNNRTALESAMGSAFQDDHYWSSSQYSADAAYFVRFSDGAVNSLVKYNEFEVVPIRRVAI